MSRFYHLLLKIALWQFLYLVRWLILREEILKELSFTYGDKWLFIQDSTLAIFAPSVMVEDCIALLMVISGLNFVNDMGSC